MRTKHYKTINYKRSVICILLYIMGHAGLMGFRYVLTGTNESNVIQKRNIFNVG